MNLGTKLKALRQGKSYSQEYVAHILRMSQANYCKLEQDHHQPSKEVVEKVAALYLTSIQELTAEAGAKSLSGHGNRSLWRKPICSLLLSLHHNRVHSSL